jgi:hypothetical protein
VSRQEANEGKGGGGESTFGQSVGVAEVEEVGGLDEGAQGLERPGGCLADGRVARVDVERERDEGLPVRPGRRHQRTQRGVEQRQHLLVVARLVVELDGSRQLGALLAGGGDHLAEPSHACGIAQHAQHQPLPALGPQEGVHLSRVEHKVLQHQVLQRHVPVLVMTTPRQR